MMVYDNEYLSVRAIWMYHITINTVIYSLVYPVYTGNV